MAISREDIQRAVDYYLPRDINPTRSAASGRKDSEETHERIVQILLTALLLDNNALFYIIYLSAQRLRTLVDSVLQDVSDLKGVNQLLSADTVDPVGVTDTSTLTAASQALNRISSSLNQSSKVNSRGLSDYRSNIEAFLTDQIKPDVRGRNRRLLERDMRRTMSSLKSAWADLYAQNEAVLGILAEYEASDLPQRASRSAVTSIRARLGYIQSVLPALNTNQQGLVSEGLMVDLAATHAVLGLVASPPSTVGQVIVSNGTDGQTADEYLLTQGSASTDPVTSVDRGTAGRVVTLDELFGTGGTVSGSGLTSTFTDTGVDFTTVQAGWFLLLVDEGASAPRTPVGSLHRIEIVTSPTSVEVSPRIPGGGGRTNIRWVVSRSHPGALFRDETKTWVDYYAGGSSYDPVIVSGSNGSFISEVLSSGTGGGNLRSQGSFGRNSDIVSNGLSHQVPGGSGIVDFIGTTLLADGIDVSRHRLYITDGASPNNNGSVGYEILSVNSDVQLEVNATLAFDFSGTTWQVADPNEFLDTTTAATFLTDGATPGDILDVDNGTPATYDGFSYTLDSLLDEVSFRVTPAFDGTAQVTGLDYDLFIARDVLIDAGASFITDGVRVGDPVSITSAGAFTVASVDSQTQITLSSDAIAYSGETWAITNQDTLLSTPIFAQADGEDFEALIPGVFTSGEASYIRVGGVYHEVTDVLSSTQVRVSPEANLTSSQAWALLSGLTTNRLTDTTNSPFGGYDVGDLVILNPGEATEARGYILDVLSNSEVVLDIEMAVAQTGIDYGVVPLVRAGMDLVTSGRRVSITEVVDATTLRVRPPLSQAVGTGLAYQVLNKGQAFSTTRIRDNSAAFGASALGKRIELQLESPVEARVRGVVSSTVLDLDTPVPLGLRDVPYRILALEQDLSDTLSTVDPEAAGVAPGDVVGVWGLNEPFVVQGTSGVYDLEVRPFLPSRLTGQEFVITRGGSSYYPKYLLFDSKASGVALPADTTDLRLKVGEFLVDQGKVVFETLGSSVGTGGFVDDREGAAETSYFEDASVDYVALGVRRGDRLTVDGTTHVYVSEDPDSANAGRLVVAPPQTIAAASTWVVERTSASESYYEASILEDKLVALRDALDGFFVPSNPTIRSLISALEERRQTRALELLYRGDLVAFVEMLDGEGNYALNARRKLQTAGRLSIPTQNREYGATTDTASSTPYSRARLVEASKARVEMSRALGSIGDTERATAEVDLDFDELVASAIYEITGQVNNRLVLDRNPTLPWLQVTGSKVDRVKKTAEDALQALLFIEANPDMFEDGV